MNHTTFSVSLMKLASIALLMTVGFASSAIAGPISKLYLTQFAGNNGVIIQGNSIISSFNTGVSTETGIAVRDTVRIVSGLTNTGPGSEYDLNGNVINPGIFNNPGIDSLYDGTTDGLFNYSIGHNDSNIGSNNVLRFDLNWQNPVVLFSMTQRGSGITYDKNTNTLWTTGGATAPFGDIQQYSMTGQLLSSIVNQSEGAQYAIAWDSADDTLWTSKFGTNILYQYSKAGALLDSTNFGGALHQNPFGMEFQLLTVPEPSSLALIGLCLAGIGVSMRKRKQQNS